MGEEASEMAMKSQIESLWGNLTASVERNANISSEIDKFFLIVMAVVIFFMQCGFAFLEAGSVRYTILFLIMNFHFLQNKILIETFTFSVDFSIKPLQGLQGRFVFYPFFCAGLRTRSIS